MSAALAALGPPPPKDISASAIEEAKSCRSGRPSAIVRGAERHEHVRDADLNLFQDLRPLTGCPAKKLNPELLGIKHLRDSAVGYVWFARLLRGLALWESDGFAIRRDISVRSRQAVGVDDGDLVSLVGDRQRGSAWPFRHRVRIGLPSPSAEPRPVKDEFAGAGDDNEGYDQSRLPTRPPQTIFPSRAPSGRVIQSRRRVAPPLGGRQENQGAPLPCGKSDCHRFRPASTTQARLHTPLYFTMR